MIFSNCKVSILFAYFSLIYLCASGYYLLVTRSYGTPFKNALQKYPKLLKIKINSVKKRKKTFYFGILIGLIICIYFKPFHHCIITN